MFTYPADGADEGSVRRRFESALPPGAWEAVASARFRRPGHKSPGQSGVDPSRISVRTLLVEGGSGKLKATGWAKRLAAQIPRGNDVTIADVGQRPQIERPHELARVVLTFIDEKEESE